MTPTDPAASARNLLREGLACCRAGAFDAALVHLRAAAALDPRNPEILIMTMRAQIDSGAPRAALALPFEAAGLPLQVVLALWRTRAEAAQAAVDHALEAEALERVVRLDPGDGQARELLIPLLIALDRPEAALAQIDALPRSVERERSRSSALIALRRLDEAAAVDAALLDADPGNREAWLSLLLIADRANDRAGLVESVAFAERSPFDPSEAAYARALLAKHDGRTEEALDQALASAVPGDPARREALVASLADRLGRADVAFAAASAKAGATPGRDVWRERGAAHRATLERLAAGMDERWAAQWTAAPALDRAAPAFLVGFPRSGTTLLDTFLMGHPDVQVVEEEAMLDLATPILGEPLALGQVEAATVALAREAYFAELDRHLPRSPDARLVIDKLPLAMTGAAAIHRLFPGAKFIFAARHPADCVLSNFLQAFRLNDAMANFLDLGDAARFYDVAMRVWTRSRDLLALDSRTLVYEQLVEDPAATLQPLVEWLGLEWDEALLDHRRTAAARGAIVTPSYDQVTQAIHRRAAGRWRLYADKLEPVRPLLEPWSIRLGYGPMD